MALKDELKLIVKEVPPVEIVYVYIEKKTVGRIW